MDAALDFFSFLVAVQGQRGKEGGSLGKRLVLWAHKEKYYQREERGGRGRREGDIKGGWNVLSRLGSARPGPPTHLIMRQVIKHTGTSNF